MFLEPKRKQREEQESTAELSEHLTEKGMVAPIAVSGFQPLGRIPAQDLSGSCFKSLCLERMQVAAFRRMFSSVDPKQALASSCSLADYVPVTNKILVRFPFPTCLPEHLHLRDTHL